MINNEALWNSIITHKKALDILGDRTKFELKHMIKALSAFGGYFNTPEDNLRLQAAKVLLKHK